MKDAFEQLMRESDKEETVPESIAKYVAALVAGTHEITSLTIRPKRTWVGLTEEDKKGFWYADQMTQKEWDELFDAIEDKLRDKNT